MINKTKNAGIRMVNEATNPETQIISWMVNFEYRRIDQSKYLEIPMINETINAEIRIVNETTNLKILMIDCMLNFENRRTDTQ